MLSNEAVRTNSHLDETDAILHIMFPEETRKRKCREFICWALLNLVVSGYIMALIAIFWYSWTIQCIRILSIWLCGYLLIHIAHLVRRVILACFWLKSTDPTMHQVQLDLAFLLLVFLPEIGW